MTDIYVVDIILLARIKGQTYTTWFLSFVTKYISMFTYITLRSGMCFDGIMTDEYQDQDGSNKYIEIR